MVRERRGNLFPPQLRARMEDVLCGRSSVGLVFVRQGLQAASGDAFALCKGCS